MACCLDAIDVAARRCKDAFMRTTIDLPDSTLRQAKARAALSGRTLKELIARYVEQGLRQDEALPTPRRRRSELPVARAKTGRPLPALTNAELHRILDEDEVSCGQRD